MKFLLSITLASVYFISNVSADASEAYEIADNALGTIMNRTNNMTDAIKAWDGTDLLAALNDIHTPSVATVQYITNATQLLQKQQVTFDSTQSFKIGTPAQRLAYAVNASVANLVRRKHDFDAANVSPSVVLDLSSLQSASQNLSHALTNLLPKELQPIASNMIAQNLQSLQQGTDCFNGTSSACYTAIVDPERTYRLAVLYNAMNPDGSPYV